VEQWNYGDVKEVGFNRIERENVKHNGRSDQLFLETMMKVAEQE